MKAGHEKNFKLSREYGYKTFIKAAYEHKSDYVEVMKNFKDEEGHVKTSPKNFYTCPNRVGENGKQIWPT